MILRGAGRVWVDDMSVEEVSRKVKRTGHFQPRSDGPAPEPEEIARLARMSTTPGNLDFEITPSNLKTDSLPRAVASRPSVQIPSWGLSGSGFRQYSASLDSETKHGGAKSAVIQCGQTTCSEFSTLTQGIRADRS